MDIYVQKDGQKQGPFSESRIRQGIDTGEFNPSDLAWATGKASWAPLSALIGLDLTQPPPTLESLPGEDSSVQSAPMTGVTKLRKNRGRSIIIVSSFIIVGSIVWIFSQWSSGTPKTAHIGLHIGLRHGEADFDAAYGQPIMMVPGKGLVPPASKTLMYGDSELQYMVHFWHDVSHAVYVSRQDARWLTDDDIQNALNQYSDGKKWNHRWGTDNWERDGASASLVKLWRNSYNADVLQPANNLRIVTKEFSEANEQAKHAE